MNTDYILNILIVFLTLYLFHELYINNKESFSNYTIPKDSQIQKEIEEFTDNDILTLDSNNLSDDMEEIFSDNKNFKNSIDDIRPNNKKKINEVHLPFKKGNKLIKNHKGCKYDKYLAEDYIRNNLLGNDKIYNNESLKKKKR